MSRQVDTSKPVTVEELEYLKGHNDERWKTAVVEEPKPKGKAKTS